MTARWDDYVLARDDGVGPAWTAAAEGRQTTYILGEGFDPRMLLALERFLAVPSLHSPKVISINLRRSDRASPTSERARANADALRGLVESHGLVYESLPYPKVAESKSAGVSVARSLVSRGFIESEAHVVIDVSSLPLGIYFPVIASVIALSDGDRFTGELQVVVAENPEIDKRIVAQGREGAGPIRGFTHGLDLAAAVPRPRIWAPILGENTGTELDLVFERLGPREVCPILPFPAKNPRRGDNLLLEHERFLFDRIEFEPANVIYASEDNPFDAYRALSQLNERYTRALAPLGRPQLVVSSHASKTLSLGALLAAHEHELPVISAGAVQHVIEEPEIIEELMVTGSLLCLWLLGQPYRLGPR